jgi:phosphoglycerol transferase
MGVSVSDLTIPFAYVGDSLHVLSVAKSIIDGQSTWYNGHLGAPFGADWRDFPVNIIADCAVMWALSWFITAPGTLVNSYWILSVMACAGIATYCLERLGVRPVIAISSGIIYALQPFTFARGIHHLNLVFHLVPLLATGAIEILTGRIHVDLSRPGLWTKIKAVHSAIPMYLYVACALQAFSYIYNAFFACFVLLVAGTLAVIVFRRWSLGLVAAVLIFIITAGTILSLSPTLLFWRTHGKPVSYKTPAEAEIYGMKIRHLLSPIHDHPVPLLRQVATKVRQANFPHENENATSNLGLTGSIGFLMIICYLLVSAISSRFHDPLYGACAALCLAVLLLATVGGFSSFFNMFMSPDIRAYNRSVVFISFFCISYVATAVTRHLQRSTSPIAHAAVLGVVTCIFTVAAVADQASTTQYKGYADRRAQYLRDRSFVENIERNSREGAMIMQIPFTEFPLDPGLHGMGVYEHAKAYIHSTKLNWSWGAMSGRRGAWNLQISDLSADQMLPRLASAGFAGLWVDERGYTQGASPSRRIQELIGGEPIQSKTGITYFDLRGYAARLLDSRSLHDRERARLDALNPVMTVFERFDIEERQGARRWRWCAGDCTLVFSNPGPSTRHVSFSATLQTAAPQGAPVEVIATDTPAETITISSKGEQFYRTIRIAPNSTIHLRFRTQAPLVVPPPVRQMRLALINPELSTLAH